MSDDKYEDWDGEFPQLSDEDELGINLLDVLKLEGFKTTHLAVVVSRVDPEGNESFDIIGGPDQPRWITNSLLERGLSQAENEAAQTALMRDMEIAFNQALADTDSGEDEEDDE